MAAVSEALPQVSEVTAEARAFNYEQVRGALQRLQETLCRGALDDQALQDLSEGLHSGPQKVALTEVRRALDDFDFDLAQQWLSKLANQLQDEEAQTP